MGFSGDFSIVVEGFAPVALNLMRPCNTMSWMPRKIPLVDFEGISLLIRPRPLNPKKFFAKRPASHENTDYLQRNDHLYIAYSRNRGLIKIGRSIDPAKRVLAFEHWSTGDVRLLAVIEFAGYLEKQIHMWFGRDWFSGEWFYPSKELISFIKSARTPKLEQWERLVDQNRELRAEQILSHQRFQTDLLGQAEFERLSRIRKLIREHRKSLKSLEKEKSGLISVLRRERRKKEVLITNGSNGDETAGAVPLHSS